MAKSKKLVKKKFFEVSTPFMSSKTHLYGASPEDFDGKVIKLDLTRNLRGKSFELKLKIKNDKGELSSEPVSLELAGSYIRRMMRTGVDYIEDSFIVECKDAKIQIKPFLLTRHKVSRAVRKALRNSARKNLEIYIKSRDSKELFDEIMLNKLQKTLSINLKKIYPLALCEVRVFKIIESKGKLQ